MKKYERLTMVNNGFIDTNCRNCKQCKKVGRKYICNDMTACNEEIITRLAELEEKIENGTLIELILSEENLAVLTESLTAYKGNKRLIADCILAIIKRQTEIQKGSKEK